MPISDKLESLGISGKLGAVYMALLQLGDASASDVARHADVKRTTAYDLLDELSRRHLATQTYRGKKCVWVAEEPQQLKTIPNQQLAVIETLLPDLNALYNANASKPRIEYYEGIKGIKFIWEKMLEAKEREYFYIGAVESMTKVVGSDYLHDYVKRRIERKVMSNAIRTNAPSEDDKIMAATDTAYRRLRYFPAPIIGDTVILHLYDNKIAITSTLKEHYGIIIESAELSRLLKAVWQCIWNISKEA